MQKVKESEALLEEVPPIRKSFADEECEPPSKDSAPVTSIPPFSVDANSDVGMKEVRGHEADPIIGDFSEAFLLISYICRLM